MRPGGPGATASGPPPVFQRHEVDVRHPIRFLPFLTLCCALALSACGGGGGTQSFATCGNDRIEQCDGRDMQSASCASFGLAGMIGCASDCTYDLSRCSIAPPTSTPLPPTASPTPSPTPRTDSCGDGLLSPGETCDSCPDDCTPQSCGSGGGEANVTVSLAVPSAATQITFALNYRTDTVSLPSPPTGRVSSLSTPALLLRATNVGGYGVNVASPPTANQSSGPFARIRFDRCAGARPPEMDDFACTVTVCRSGSVDLTGCTCVGAP
jgi:hypothetical protein